MAASEFYSKCSKEGFRSGDDMILWVSVIILLQCCHREKELGGGEAVMVSWGGGGSGLGRSMRCLQTVAVSSDSGVS